MADQESQIWPLAPAKLYRRSDEVTPAIKAIRRERSNKCFVYVFAAVVIQAVVLLVFALVFLRVKFPGFNLTSVSVKTLKSTTSPSATFNATLIAQLAVKNNNFGEYRFEGGDASLWSQGFKVGEAKTVKGSAKARGTRKMNVTIEIKSSWLPQEVRSNLTAEMNSGFLKISSYAKLSGRVHLINIIKTNKTIEMKCTMVLVLKSRTIKDLKCS